MPLVIYNSSQKYILLALFMLHSSKEVYHVYGCRLFPFVGVFVDLWDLSDMSNKEVLVNSARKCMKPENLDYKAKSLLSGFITDDKQRKA